MRAVAPQFSPTLRNIFFLHSRTDDICSRRARARARVQSHFLSENRFALLVLILTTLPRACTRRKILVAASAAYSLKKLINAYYAPKKVKLSFFCPLTILTGVRWPRAPSMYRIHRCAHHPPINQPRVGLWKSKN